MKKTLALIAMASFAIFGAFAFAGMPVIDAANLANNQISHIATIAKWVENIAQLKAQIQQLKEQASIQGDIRSWAGDPSKAAQALLLDILRESDLNREYGRSRDDITQSVHSLDVLTRNDRNTYRPVDIVDIDGRNLQYDPQLYRRYSVLDARQDNARAVADELLVREREFQEEIALTLVDLRSAGTDAQVQKLTAKLTVLNGQLAQLESTRRRQVDEVILQNSRMKTVARSSNLPPPSCRPGTIISPTSASPRSCAHLTRAKSPNKHGPHAAASRKQIPNAHCRVPLCRVRDDGCRDHRADKPGAIS